MSCCYEYNALSFPYDLLLTRDTRYIVSKIHRDNLRNDVVAFGLNVMSIFAEKLPSRTVVDF